MRTGWPVASDYLEEGMSAILRTFTRAFIVFALLAAASCSGQSTSGLDQPASVVRETASAGHGKKCDCKHKDHKPKACKPKHSKHQSCRPQCHKPRRDWKPKCRCRCNPCGSRNQPPVAGVALATVNGSTFEFRPEGSVDPDGTIVKYEWDFESDGTYDFTSADGLTSHTFDGGDYTVTLRVTDNKGATATASFDLHANFAPTALINIATTNATDFSFSGSDSSDPEGAIQKWEWDFDGDGIFEETYFTDPGNISHSFSGGDHEVSLRVTDGLDATDTQTITVTGNFPPVARITVTDSHRNPDGSYSYDLYFGETTDVEGPLYRLFVDVNGTVFELPADLSMGFGLDVPAGETRTVILTVIDGNDASDFIQGDFDSEGNVFFADN